MSLLTLPAPRVDFLDQRTGKVSREWVLFFQQSFERMGGSDAATIAAISTLIRSILASIADKEVELAFVSDMTTTLESAIEFVSIPAATPDAQDRETYDAQITELRKQVDDLRASIDSIVTGNIIAELQKKADDILLQLATLPDQSAQVGEIRKRIKDISTPAVTGSRGGNAALASLLTSLASYGLITDSTTA